MTTTQNCAECGTRAEPGQSFCDACGAVLSWGNAAHAGGAPTGEREGRAATVAAPAASAGSAAASAPSASASTAASGAGTASGTLPRRAPGQGPTPAALPHPEGSAATGGGDDASPGADAPAAAPASPPPVEPAATAQLPEQPGPGAPTAGHGASAPVGEPGPGAATSGAPAPAASDDHLADRARRLLVPVADPQAAAAPPSVAPVLPGRPLPQRPQTVRAPGEELGAGGGIPCPWCSTPNRPDRHFCTRCAMPMAGEEAGQGRLPWWRRLFRFGNREIPWAGDRPRLRRTFDRVLTWLGAALVLTLLIVLVVNIPKGVQATRDHFAKRAPISPDRVSASRSYPGHKPELAFDALNNTWWGPGVSQSGEGQWIEAKFDQPVRLLDLVITPGVSARADQLSQSALPHRVKAIVKTSQGRTETTELALDQGAGGQRRQFRFSDVTSVRFTVESSYGVGAKKQVAVAEIEFFGPSNGG
ncbi:zinc ribbon domain-containing protein [Streptomyces sp. NPDC048664]|uniref:NADase-type glycan-binding domain-containing protein n=1 Tax=Streptomyces sp. NPDC048664 TaxID=3154505 RepID=UPI0034289D80